MAGLAHSRRWTVLAHNAEAERKLAAELGLPPLVARVLASRGVTDVDEARAFLSPSLERDWADPLCIPGMAEAADRVDAALAAHQTIAVFGDFDVDGMSATCLLTLGLRRLGGNVHPYIPHRFGEGYGLSQAALARVRDDCDPDLVITVDNGIAAAAEVAWLVGEGVDVVVTDHHEPADLVPQGVPVTDPKLAESCPSRELAGAGVALKLVAELGRRHGQPGLWREYTDVATLGTLSDMMLLEGENRALVADGIARMRRVTRPGLVALAAMAGQDLARATADGLPFSIIPRLNAAGRMGTTDVAFDLLMVEDPATASVLAGELEATNTERRATEGRLSEAAIAEAERVYHGGRCVVVGGCGWHEGVKGIVASRLVNRYHVPSIVFTVDDEGIARGSGRSVGTVDLFHAVEQCSDCLVRFGGHAGAVGVTCEAARLDEFRDRLEASLADLPVEQFEDTGEVTATVGLDELNVESIGGLECLQPFGQGNKKPLFAACGVVMRNRARVGADGSHLRFVATDGKASVPAIMFRAPEPERALSWDGAVDLVFEAVNETWQGRTKPKLMVKDILFRDAAPDGAGERDLTAGMLAQEDEEDAAAVAGAVSGSGAAAAAGIGSGGASGVAAASAPASGEKPRGAADDAPVPAADVRRELSALPPDELTDRLRRQMIGDAGLLPAQASALGRLARGRSTMAVMATGRGKSLIFHLHAAREAIAHGRASVFVYPLRALVADQAFHLAEALAPVGVSVEVLTGESDEAERERVFGALADGSADVVLTTPEFLAIHRDRFAASGRVGFLVVDEAHHAGMAKSGSRSAYLELPEVRRALGDPVCLGVTATAAPEVAREVCRLLGVADDDLVKDEAVRANLVIDDEREARDRDAALVGIVASGEKTVVYVNTRNEAVRLCRLLRHAIPELAPRVSFYHAGLSRKVRGMVERAFRSDELDCIVSTSAFGEGVNLPGIRHAVLYTLPFGAVEFNQMSGRAGRDGAPATVHLLFGSRDIRPDDQIISSAAPDRACLVALYRTLMGLAKGGTPVTLGDDELAAASAGVDARHPLMAAEVASGLGIFEELGFLRVEGFGDGRKILMEARPERMELTSSVRYLEGQRLREAFAEFSSWALDSSADALLARINRPITPDFGVSV